MPEESPFEILPKCCNMVLTLAYSALCTNDWWLMKKISWFLRQSWLSVQLGNRDGKHKICALVHCGFSNRSHQLPKPTDYLKKTQTNKKKNPKKNPHPPKNQIKQNNTKKTTTKTHHQTKYRAIWTSKRLLYISLRTHKKGGPHALVLISW